MHMLSLVKLELSYRSSSWCHVFKSVYSLKKERKRKPGKKEHTLSSREETETNYERQ